MSLLNKIFDWLMESKYAPVIIATMILAIIGITLWQIINKCTIM